MKAKNIMLFLLCLSCGLFVSAKAPPQLSKTTCNLEVAGAPNALMLAVKEGNLADVNSLLAKGQDITMCEYNGHSVFDYNALCRKGDCVKIFKVLAALPNANIYTVNYEDKSLSDMAFIYRNRQMLKLFEEYKIPHNLSAKKLWGARLVVDSGNGDLEAVKEDLKNGADASYQDISVLGMEYVQENALAVAVSKGNLAIVEILIKSGADVNVDMLSESSFDNSPVKLAEEKASAKGATSEEKKIWQLIKTSPGFDKKKYETSKKPQSEWY